MQTSASLYLLDTQDQMLMQSVIAGCYSASNARLHNALSTGHEGNVHIHLLTPPC